MKLRKKILVSVSAIAVGLTSLLINPGTAGATLADCPNGWICLWQDGPFVNGPGHRMLRFNAPGRYDLGDFSFNDQMSSWANKTGHNACWYEHGDLAGRHFMPANSSSAVVTPNDTASVLIIGNC